MELSVLLEFGWVLLVLIALEGVLAADNALVIAVMLKHLPEEKRKKALYYGLAGAVFFRLGSLFLISYLVNIWQVQAIGSIYLLFIMFNHLVRKFLIKKSETKVLEKNKSGSSFWMTVLKVEVADIAFAVDSILAAVALAITLPTTSLPTIGGLDGGHFLVIFLGGFTGVVIIRYAATYLVRLLHRKPGLETAAFLIVGWVGVKLAVITLAHPEMALIAEDFPHHAIWKITFWVVLLLIAVTGWIFSKEVQDKGEVEPSAGTEDQKGVYNQNQNMNT